MLSINLKSPQDVLLELARRAKERRLELNLSQSGLAFRSGVSLGSLKRFERLGEISLASLLKIALVLDCLSAFDGLFQSKSAEQFKSIDEFMRSSKQRQRGKLK